MPDKLRELLSRIEDLSAVDSQPLIAAAAAERANCRLVEAKEPSNHKRRRTRFKSLDEDGLEQVRRLTRDDFSDFLEFQELSGNISELALDAGQEEIGEAFTGDDLFIIPIVDEEREVTGRSVFAFVR